MLGNKACGFGTAPCNTTHQHRRETGVKHHTGPAPLSVSLGG